MLDKRKLLNYIPERARLISPKRTLVQTPRSSLCLAALADARLKALHKQDMTVRRRGEKKRQVQLLRRNCEVERTSKVGIRYVSTGRIAAL